MPEAPASARRRFLGSAAMTMGALSFGVISAADATGRESREMAAIGRATEWLNSPRLTAASLIGKVVLVQFWTYTCINWLRTLPYVRAWSQKYTPGLVVVGVHAPEFPFEHDLANVRRAVEQMTITYPVVIDNDHGIWRAFRNQYWPALYFVDARGKVRNSQFGEGEYERSERTLQRLLTEAGASDVGLSVVGVEGRGVEAAADWVSLRSPENYLGHQRTQNFASPGGADPDRPRIYSIPKRLALNQWAIAGEWTLTQGTAALTGSAGRLACRFHARDLHMVLGPRRGGDAIRFRVSLDGQPPGLAHGLDIDAEGAGRVAEQRLYQLVRQPGPIADRLFEIEFLDAGAEAFAFTFG